jgi:predicted ATPase
MAATSALEPLDASLLERDRELAAIDDALGEAAAGRGRLLLVEGPAGIGKTTLVKAAVALARERGLPALTGHGAPLEREFSYGTVRQLFEPVRI